MAKQGASIYLAATELTALHDAGGYLSSLIEQCSEPPADLVSAQEGLHSLIDKVSAAQRAARGRVVLRNKVRQAVREAESLLAG